MRRHEGAIPIFGICRGCQVINAGYGGSLYQDLATGALDEAQPLPMTHRFHPVRLTRPTSPPLARRGVIPTTQAVARLGGAEGDRMGGRWRSGYRPVEEPVLGVQWHPERLDPPDRWAIELFISMCEAIRAR